MAQCDPPPNCGTAPHLSCTPYTDYNWAIVPDGAGGFNIFAERPFETGVVVSFHLLFNNTVVESITGNSVVFEHKPPLCYTLEICIDQDGESVYCCLPLSCIPQDMGCCELRYSFYSNVASPVWSFGDNIKSNESSPEHEYVNVNTYPGEGTPSVQVTLTSNGNIQFQQQIDFPAGIYIGMDCQNSGNASAIVNSINPSLFVLPGLTHNNKSIAIKGSVTMDQDYQFTGCDFCMNPSSRILSKTATLSFLNGTALHEAACKTGSWYGVELQNGSITGTNSSFKGAYNAIITRPAHNIGNTVLRLTGCTFERNYLGINLSSPLTFGAFSGNLFGNENSLLNWPGLPPVLCSWYGQIGKAANPQPFAGIYAETPADRPIVTVGFPGVPSAINRFVNLSNGIYLNDANGLTLQRCQFKNMLAGGYPNDDGMGIALFTSNMRRLAQFGLGKASTDLTFDNCVHAVLVEMPQSSSGDVLLQSIQNNMENVQNGYTLRGGFTATFRDLSYIRHNKINYTGEHGILCENISPNSRLQINFNRVATANPNSFVGIWAIDYAPQSLAGTDFRIKVGDNRPATGINFEDGIYGGTRGVHIAASAHVLVQNNMVVDFSEFGIGNSSSPEVDIRCNNISSASGNSLQNYASPSVLAEYNQTNASNFGIVFTSPSNNSTIKCNQIGSHDVGLFYDAFAEVGEQLQGGLSAGNIWNGPFATWAAQLSFGGNPAINKFYYRTGEINPTQISSLIPGWFTMVTSGVTCAAGSCPSNQTPSRAVTGQDTKVADGTTNPSGLSGYLLKRFLYNDLLYYPSMLQGNTAMQTFESNFSTTNGGKLVAAEKNMADGFILTPTQQSQWNATAGTIDSIYLELAVLDSLVQNGSDAQAQQAQRTALWLQDSTKQAALQSLYSSNLSARTAAAAAIIQTINSVSPSTQWETNEKTLNTIFANTAFIDLPPSVAQIAQILQIAQQCSADGGPAVYRARAWYHTLTGVSVSVNCNGFLERSSIENYTTNELKLSISPNPAYNNIQVRVLGVIKGGSLLEIFDALGKLRYATPVAENSQNIEISTLAFTGGVYFCHLTENGKVVSTSKFVVQH